MGIRRTHLGGGLLCLGGATIAYVPLVFVPTTGVSLGALGGDLLPVGGVLGGLVVVCGVVSIVGDEYAVYSGIGGIVLSVLSFVGAFGGLIVGAVLGVVGGSVCVLAGLNREDGPDRAADLDPEDGEDEWWWG